MKTRAPTVAAKWMLEEVQSEGTLYQDCAVDEIIRRFGEEFVYGNENGNPAIRKDVLAAFRAISQETVVWERGERLWRLRENLDDPGRQQY